MPVTAANSDVPVFETIFALAGCTTIFVDWGYRDRRPERPDATVRSLPDAVDWILSRSQVESSSNHDPS